MRCVSIELNDYRNISRAFIEPSPGVNLLLGDNAAGKTSALEGIYLFAAGRSFRGAGETSLIRFGTPMAGLRLRYTDTLADLHTLELRYCANTIPSPDRRTPVAECRRIAKVEGVPVRRLSEFIGNFRAVIFAPEDLDLVKGGPAVRRDLLDSALSRLYPDYLSDLSAYNTLLRQRSALIRSHAQKGGSASDASFRTSLSVWSEQLAPLCERIAEARVKYAVILQTCAGELMRGMSGGKEELRLVPAAPKTADEYLYLLTSQLERELAAGTTLSGIHRDDLGIMLAGLPLRAFGSQGQQRTAALSVKLAEGDAVRQIKGDYPVFLLDDILSELDENRQERLLECLGDRQVIITAAQLPPSCTSPFHGEANIIPVRAGKFGKDAEEQNANQDQ